MRDRGPVPTRCRARHRVIAMPTSMRAASVLAKGNPLVSATERQDKALVLRSLMRQAIDESGWKYDAVAAAISAATGRSIDGPYLSKMLAGEKPLSAEVLEGLPDDIEAILARLYAESFGQFVVSPASDDSAVQHFVAGLLGILRSQLPARATAMAKARLR